MRKLLSRRELFTAAPTQPGPVVHIASLLLHIVPDALDRLRRVVAELPLAELHATAHPAKFAVLLEAGNEQLLADATERLQNLRGVLTVSIVAHLSESARYLDQPVEGAGP